MLSRRELIERSPGLMVLGFPNNHDESKQAESFVDEFYLECIAGGLVQKYNCDKRKMDLELIGIASHQVKDKFICLHHVIKFENEKYDRHSERYNNLIVKDYQAICQLTYEYLNTNIHYPKNFRVALNEDIVDISIKFRAYGIELRKNGYKNVLKDEQFYLCQFKNNSTELFILEELKFDVPYTFYKNNLNLI